MARWFGVPKGPFVLPGTYKLVLEYGMHKLEKEVPVKKDKNLDYPLQEWKENQNYVILLGDLLQKGFFMAVSLKVLDKQLQELDRALKKMKEPPKPVMDKFENLRQNGTGLLHSLSC